MATANPRFSALIPVISENRSDLFTSPSFVEKVTLICCWMYLFNQTHNSSHSLFLQPSRWKLTLPLSGCYSCAYPPLNFFCWKPLLWIWILNVRFFPPRHEHLTFAAPHDHLPHLCLFFSCRKTDCVHHKTTASSHLLPLLNWQWGTTTPHYTTDGD